MKKIEPQFDKYGYPNKNILRAIKNWDIEDVKGLLKYIMDTWKYFDDVQETKPGLWLFSTGNWVGNENLLEALYHSAIWNTLDSIKLPDGFLIIAVTETAKKELKEMKKKIIKWAWQKKDI